MQKKLVFHYYKYLIFLSFHLFIFLFPTLGDNMQDSRSGMGEVFSGSFSFASGDQVVRPMMDGPSKYLTCFSIYICIYTRIYISKIRDGVERLGWPTIAKVWPQRIDVRDSGYAAGYRTHQLSCCRVRNGHDRKISPLVCSRPRSWTSSSSFLSAALPFLLMCILFSRHSISLDGCMTGHSLPDCVPSARNTNKHHAPPARYPVA